MGNKSCYVINRPKYSSPSVIVLVEIDDNVTERLVIDAHRNPVILHRSSNTDMVRKNITSNFQPYLINPSGSWVTFIFGKS